MRLRGLPRGDRIKRGSIKSGAAKDFSNGLPKAVSGIQGVTSGGDPSKSHRADPKAVGFGPFLVGSTSHFKHLQRHVGSVGEQLQENTCHRVDQRTIQSISG